MSDCKNLAVARIRYLREAMLEDDNISAERYSKMLQEFALGCWKHWVELSLCQGLFNKMRKRRCQGLD
jgi:hypothetical protein